MLIISLCSHAVPDPSRMTVMSDLGNLVISGVDVTLTCTVELNSDLAGVSTIGVTTAWTGPSGVLSSGSVPMMTGNPPPTYTSTLILSAVTSDDDGNYTCQATTISSSPYLLSSASISKSITISVGKIGHCVVSFVYILLQCCKLHDEWL